MPKDLMGLQEASDYLELHKEQIRRLINSGRFPEPIVRLASGPVWKRKQIEEWKEER